MKPTEFIEKKYNDEVSRLSNERDAVMNIARALESAVFDVSSIEIKEHRPVDANGNKYPYRCLDIKVRSRDVSENGYPEKGWPL